MESLEYTLQKFDPGVVLLDANHRIVAMNQVAHRVLGDVRGDPIGRDVLQLHPQKSREKLELLLRSGSGDQRGPADSPPMTMMINIPDRVLLIKVASLSDGTRLHSTCMMFYDLTDITTEAHGARGRESRPKQLVKIPVLLLNRVVLLSMSDVVHMRADGHYTRIFTFDQDYFCNLSLSDLELRLNPEQFMRTHRSHIINLQRVHMFEREDEQYRVVLDTKDRTRVPISRNRADDVKEYFGLT
jgi:hypothetical protein